MCNITCSCLEDCVARTADVGDRIGGVFVVVDVNLFVTVTVYSEIVVVGDGDCAVTRRGYGLEVVSVAALGL